MSSSSAFQRSFRVASTLNNIGVSLLERQRYRDSMTVFKNAIEVMKDVSASCSLPNHKLQCCSSELDLMLTEANRMIALSHQQGLVTRSSKNNNFTIVVSEDEMPAVVGAAIQDEEQFFHSETTHLIRLELHGKSLYQTDVSDVDLECSIILSNYGNAYKCMSIAASATDGMTVKQTEKLCEGALRLFELSYTLLQRTPSEDDITEIIPFAIHTLRCLICLAMDLGLAREAEAFYSKLLEVQQSFCVDFAVLLSTQDAAAAA